MHVFKHFREFYNERDKSGAGKESLKWKTLFYDRQVIHLFVSVSSYRSWNRWKYFRPVNDQENPVASNRSELFIGKFSGCRCSVTSLLFCGFSLIPMIKVLPDGAVGTVLCMFIVGLNVPLTATVVSVLTLTILAIERYNAVVRPLRMLQPTRETVRYAIIGTWIPSVALNTPLFVYTNYKFKTAACRQTYSEHAELTHIVFYIIFVFTLPFLVISFCYSKLVKALNHRSVVTHDSNIPEKELIRQRKQLLKMSVTVTLVFGACVLPHSMTGRTGLP